MPYQWHGFLLLTKSSFPLIADRLLRRLTTAVRVLAVHP
nr:MAG TPA: hypothetical protein [Caudoviricetes sp.]